MILVTGGTGFIGRNLIRSLVQRGEQVRVLLRPSKISPNFPKGISVEVAVSSFSDQRSLRAALKDVNIIFHLAGAERYGVKGNLNQIDVEGTSTLLRAAQDSKVSRIFYLSHNGADRGSAFPVLKAKGIAENWILNSGIPYTIFRTDAVFGPGDQFTVPLVKLLRLSPGFILIPGDGSVLVQPLWINDLITCLLLAKDDPKMVNRLLAIGGIEALSYREILNMIMKETGYRRFLLSVSPEFLRQTTLWVDQLYPKFPISIYWLDQLAADRISNLDTIPREFNLMPSRFKNHIDYLKNWKTL
jgi:NADH dehydrogenase